MAIGKAKPPRDGEASSDGAGARAPGGAAGVSRIGPSVVIKGELVASNERLEIYGRVEGIIEHDRGLVVRPGGVVKAALIADDVRIEGDVEGNVYARERLALAGGASACGNLLTPSFAVEEGARLRGQVDMEARREDVERRFQRDERKQPLDEPALKIDEARGGTGKQGGDDVEEVSGQDLEAAASGAVAGPSQADEQQ